MTTPVHPRKILIVGGGPAGLVTLRNLIERGDFDHVELVERRDDVGGVWYLDDPQKDPLTSGQPRWPSPAYPGLIGNVLPEFLSYSQFPFPDLARPHQPFPTLAETHSYLQSFAQPHLASGAIRLNTEVVAVEELEEGAGWKVSLRDWKNGAGGLLEEIWDGVVIANGWYDTPIWPETEGLEQLRDLGLAKHSKSYRGPTEYAGKRCLIIGNANSSNDMAAHLTRVASVPVYQSVRHPALPGFPSLPDERITTVTSVAKYSTHPSAAGPKVEALLTDGTLLRDIDVVLVGTGYKPCSAFVHVLSPTPGRPPTLTPLVAPPGTQNRVPGLHRHILYAHNPTLAFIGAPFSHTPLTLADVASTWLALAWHGRIAYPDTAEGRLVSEAERLALVAARRATRDNPTVFVAYSVLAEDEQAYASALRADVVRAEGALDAVLPVWNDERTRAREAMWAVKRDSLQHAKDNCGVLEL